MKKLIILICLLSITSCDILKESQKTKKDIQANATEKITTVNKGGSITTDILSEENRPKDSKGRLKDTVVVVKRDEITKTIYYNPDGTVTTTTECPDTNITEERALQLMDQSKNKESKKEESFQTKIVIYVILGLLLMFIFLIVYVVWRLEKLIKTKSS